MTARSRQLHAIVRAAAQRTGATYVNLFQSSDDDPFVRDPVRYHAVDGFHPNDEGYALWVAKLMTMAPVGSLARTVLN